MSRFKKKKGSGTPAISTASLPDIVFMLLFQAILGRTTPQYKLIDYTR